MLLDIKKGSDWQELAAKLFCVGFFALLVYLLFKYAFAVLLPFVIAYIVSLVVNPLSSATAKRTGIPRKLCAAIYVTLAILALFGGIAFFVHRLFLEIEEFISGEEGKSVLSQAVSAMSNMLNSVRDKLSISENESLAGLGGVGNKLYGFVAEVEKNVVNAVSSAIPSVLSGIVSGAPSIFIGVAVTVMACYYFCMDGGAISVGIKKAIPERYRQKLTGFISLSKTALKRYLKAYLILMLITFCEVFAGLLILKVKYAFLIAVCVSVVDVLPVLGAGTVLVPWAVICFFGGNVRLGLGLLILYGVVTVIRQIAEPQVVGTSIGLHPAASLFSMYAGLRLFGLFGMLTGPAVAFMVSEIAKGESKSGEKIKNRT